MYIYIYKFHTHTSLYYSISPPLSLSLHARIHVHTHTHADMQYICRSKIQHLKTTTVPRYGRMPFWWSAPTAAKWRTRKRRCRGAVGRAAFDVGNLVPTCRRRRWWRASMPNSRATTSTKMVSWIKRRSSPIPRRTFCVWISLCFFLLLSHFANQFFLGDERWFWAWKGFESLKMLFWTCLMWL